MIISVVNHKGGTGKTTTVANLGRALSLLGEKVLLVDFDAQGSLSYLYGIDEHHATLTEVFKGELNLEEITVHSEELCILPANTSLADIEVSFTNSEKRLDHLRNLIDQYSRHFDYVLIDCPPSLSLLTLNAIIASNAAIVPMQMDVLSLRGLDSIVKIIGGLEVFNSQIEILGILAMMVDNRRKMTLEIRQHILSNYNIKILESSIRPSVKAAESPSFGKSVIDYAPSSNAAQDYKKLALEVLQLTKSKSFTKNQYIK